MDVNNGVADWMGGWWVTVGSHFFRDCGIQGYGIEKIDVNSTSYAT